MAAPTGLAGLLPLSLGLLRAATVEDVLAAVSEHGSRVLGGRVSVVLVRTYAHVAGRVVDCAPRRERAGLSQLCACV